MKKTALLSGLVLLSSLIPLDLAEAQEPLHVVKSSVNAESENAEFCLEFDHALAPLAPTRLATVLKLVSSDKPVTPQNIEASGSSLCVFPLERKKNYHLEVSGLRGASDEKMMASYSQSFIIPDRSPSLAFTAQKGDVGGFGSYKTPFVLRAVNVEHVTLEIYRITDAASMARAWQDRAQTTLAPSESAYLGRTKGQKIWQSDDISDIAPNATLEQPITLADKVPDLAPGLYVLIADAGNGDTHPANKGLAPLAVTWFTKSNFSLRALHDEKGLHVFASQMRNDIHLIALNRKQESVIEAQSATDGVGFLAYPATLLDKNDIATVIGIDPAGNIAFADNESLPISSNQSALGIIQNHEIFAVPGEKIDLSLVPPESFAAPSLLRLTRDGAFYSDFVLAPDASTISFSAPQTPGVWHLHWQTKDGATLADSPLSLTANPDAPHLEVSSDRDFLVSGAVWPISLHSLTNSDKPAPLTGGDLSVAWQRLDPTTLGWKDYVFGVSTTPLPAAAPVGNFLTDLEGVTSLRLTLPTPPSEPGLYQAILNVHAEPDSGTADAQPLVLPLRPEATVVGIKALTAGTRFAQNSIARFALIGLSSEGKPRDMSGVSYQIYEEGRSFAWYQDEGRWKYKPEPQLRPIGGGSVAIKAEANSVLEWPVTAGNYRLVLLDSNGKTLAQTNFSAGWDSRGTAEITGTPLNVTVPKILHAGQETTAHISLPEPSMLTLIVADQHIRKIVHEFRDKGDQALTFTPAADWQKDIHLVVDVTPQNDHAPLHTVVEAVLVQNKPLAIDGMENTSLFATIPPAATLLRKDGKATLVFGLKNNGAADEVYSYAFTASAGLKIEGGAKGRFTLSGKQSRSLSLAVSGDIPGVKDIKLDVTGTHTPLLSHSWTMEVLPKTNALRSTETYSVAPTSSLISAAAKAHPTTEATMALVSPRSLEGMPEILSFVFEAHPFTTEELALSIDALRLWNSALTQMGFASDALVSARRQEWLAHLLNHQNNDGGFSALRGGDSTMQDTAAGLTALGPDMSEQIMPAKNLAITWLKQRLSNTWFDEKERPDRAAAYAALAAADALDLASLHYFSDTGATDKLPALADAHMAAAFKQRQDPNAAAFWIKKMLDENPGDKNIALLNALSATDALSSDDVHQAVTLMADILRHGNLVEIKSAAALLRAVAADTKDAGKRKISVGTETKNISGVLALHLSDPSAALYRNADEQPLSVTLVAEANSSSRISPSGASLARHIYRLNGVELAPQTQPARGEIYIVEITGILPPLKEGEVTLVQDGIDSVLRPLGCPVPAQDDTLSFAPWLSLRDLTSIASCSFSAHELNVVLAPTEESDGFRIVYFAHLDAAKAAEIGMPRIRVLK